MDTQEYKIIKYEVAKGWKFIKEQVESYGDLDQDQKNDLLYLFVNLGDAESVQEMINLGAKRNIDGNLRETTLACAIKNADYKIFKILLDSEGIVVKDYYKPLFDSVSPFNENHPFYIKEKRNKIYNEIVFKRPDFSNKHGLLSWKKDTSKPADYIGKYKDIINSVNISIDDIRKDYYKNMSDIISYLLKNGFEMNRKSFVYEETSIKILCDRDIDLYRMYHHILGLTRFSMTSNIPHLPGLPDEIFIHIIRCSSVFDETSIENILYRKSFRESIKEERAKADISSDLQTR